MNGITLAATVENVATRKDRSIKVTIGTQELTPADAGQLLSLQNQLIAVYLSPKDISRDEIDKVDKLDPELGGKTQSERIRNTLYILFQQDNGGIADFDTFYNNKTEKYIQSLKSRIK